LVIRLALGGRMTNPEASVATRFVPRLSEPASSPYARAPGVAALDGPGPADRSAAIRRTRSIAEEMMYRSATLARESSGDLTIVMTFALLGLALSLLAIGRGGLIDAEYMADLLLLF
jgi:hypothetical protein